MVVCPPHDRSVAGRRSDSLDCAANTALCPVSPRPWSSSWLIAASGVNYSPDSVLPRYSIANTSGARFHKQVRHLSQLCASDKFLGLVLLWNGSTCFGCLTQPFPSCFQLPPHPKQVAMVKCLSWNSRWVPKAEAWRADAERCPQDRLCWPASPSQRRWSLKLKTNSSERSTKCRFPKVRLG